MFKRTATATLAAALGITLAAAGPTNDPTDIANEEAEGPTWRNVIRVTGDYHPADVDHNGLVDMNDVFALVQQWGDCEGCTGDLTLDGFVDYEDLYIVLRFIDVDVQPERGGEIGGEKTPKGKADHRQDGTTVRG